MIPSVHLKLRPIRKITYPGYIVFIYKASTTRRLVVVVAVGHGLCKYASEKETIKLV